MKAAFLAVALCLVAPLASADGAVNLAMDNFDANVYDSGKNAFVKFLAPWYGPVMDGGG